MYGARALRSPSRKVYLLRRTARRDPQASTAYITTFHNFLRPDAFHNRMDGENIRRDLEVGVVKVWCL